MAKSTQESRLNSCRGVVTPLARAYSSTVGRFMPAHMHVVVYVCGNIKNSPLVKEHGSSIWFAHCRVLCVQPQDERLWRLFCFEQMSAATNKWGSKVPRMML